MEEIKRITIYLGLEEYPLEFITLAPMSPDEADLITEMGEGFFKDINPEMVDEYVMEDKLNRFYDEVRLRTEVELFCPLFEKETIANIERLIETYEG